MRRSIVLVGLLVVALVVCASLVTYYEVYPGPQVLSVPVGGMSFGPVPAPRILGAAFEFNSSGSALLHISLATNVTSSIYLLDTTQAMQYTVYNSTSLGSTGVPFNATVEEVTSISPASYPSSFLYSSALSEHHSAYVSVQRDTLYYLVVLSLSNATEIGIPSGAVYGYAALV